MVESEEEFTMRGFDKILLTQKGVIAVLLGKLGRGVYTIGFLAAMSSLRSDIVSPSVCAYVRM